MQTDLLALDLAGVAGHEAGLAELALQAFVVLDQGASDAEADRTGLAGDAAAGDGCSPPTGRRSGSAGTRRRSASP